MSLAYRARDALASRGGALLAALLGALAGRAPTPLRPALAECVLAVLAAAGGVADGAAPPRQWLDAAFGDAAGALGAARARLGDDTWRRVHAAILRLATPSGKRRCKMLLQDFAQICNGETGPEGLLSYEMAS